MTPKEKAEELYKKMYTQHPNVYPSTAKQCALICVDEVMDALKGYDFYFWIEVKQELNKL